MQHTATHCNTLQHTATHCTTLHHTAPQFNESSKHHQLNGAFMSHMNAVTHSYLLWMKYPWLTCMTYPLSSWCLDDALIVLKCVAGVLQACCSMLQCVAAFCSVLQCVALCYWYLDDSLIDWIFRRLWMKSHSFIAVVHTLQHSATHYSALQRTWWHAMMHAVSLIYSCRVHTATHCNTLQHTATHTVTCNNACFQTQLSIPSHYVPCHSNYLPSHYIPFYKLHKIPWNYMRFHEIT